MDSGFHMRQRVELMRRAASLAIPKMAIAAAVSLLTGGCAQIAPDAGHQREEREQVSRIDKHSAFPAIRRTYFEQINLVEMIDPEGAAAATFPKTWPSGDGDGELQWGVRYDLTLNWFRSTEAMKPEKKAIHRNSIQDKMLAVSTSRCNVFKTYLRRQQADVNFALGTATTAAGVLGAVLPGANSSRNLAGVAGFLSGAQAEFNSAYFSNLAAQVIVQGIELRQSRLRKELMQSRQGKSIDDYSLEAAINDALVLDGTCSAVTGLVEAAESIKEVTSPGLPRAAEVIAAVKATGEIAQSRDLLGLMETGKLEKLLKTAAPQLSPLVVANLTQAGPGATALLDALAGASSAAAVIREHQKAVAALARSDFIAAQGKLEESARAAGTVSAQLSDAFLARAETIAQALPLQRCTGALRVPAEEFGRAHATVRLQPDDGGAGVSATSALAVARVNAQAAVARVNLLVDFAKSATDDLARAWQAEYGRKSLELTVLKGIATKPVPQALADLCKP